jgi:hypothetical protein
MLSGLDFEPLSGGKKNGKGKELFSSHQVVEGFSESFFQISALVCGLSRAIELLAVGRTAQEYWLAPRSRPNHKPQKSCQAALFARSVSRREKQSTARLAEGLVNLGSSTDRNPDRSSSGDGIGASGATDILPVDGNSGSAGSPRGSNKVSGQLGRCRRGSLHLLSIGRVP